MERIADMDQVRRIEMLGTDDPDQVRAAIDDLVERGTVADWEELFLGYTCVGGGLSTRRPGPLRWSDQHPRNRREPTMTALLAAAPEGTTADALRGAITWYSATGNPHPARPWTPEPEALRPVDLDPLLRLPNLRYLHLEDVNDLRGLAELIAAGLLTSIRLNKVGVRELDLAPLTALQDLFIRGAPGLVALRGLPASLRKLELYELPSNAVVDVSAATGLEELHVNDSPLPRPSEALRGLRALTTNQHDAQWMAPLTRVETFASWQLPGTAVVAAMTELRALQVWRSDGGTTLTPLRLPALERLEIKWVRGLTSCAGLVGSELPAVRCLQVHGDELVSLAGLEVIRGAVEVNVRGGALTDIGAAAAWSEVTTLAIHSPVLTDLTPLAGLSKLRDVDLSGCRLLRDLSPLAGRALHSLNLSNTRATRASIPEDLHAVVHPPGRAAVRKPVLRTEAAPAPPPADLRRSFARLRKLLLTRDLAQLQQGVELARALGDADLFEAFLSGSTLGVTPPLDWWTKDRLFIHGTDLLPETYDEVVPNALLAYGKPSRPFRQATIRALVGYAPAGSPTGVLLRAGLRQVLCDGQASGYSANPVDVAPLAALPHLDTLALVNVSELVNRPCLAEAPKLRVLALAGIRDSGLGGLASMTVEDLVLTQLEGMKGFDFGAFPRVRRLHLEIRHAQLHDLTPLRDLRSLRSVKLVMPSLTDPGGGVGVLAELPHLETLVLDGVTLTRDDLDALAEAPSLRRLELRDAVVLEGDLPPRLKELAA